MFKDFLEKYEDMASYLFDIFFCPHCHHLNALQGLEVVQFISFSSSPRKMAPSKTWATIFNSFGILWNYFLEFCSIQKNCWKLSGGVREKKTPCIFVIIFVAKNYQLLLHNFEDDFCWNLWRGTFLHQSWIVFNLWERSLWGRFLFLYRTSKSSKYVY